MIKILAVGDLHLRLNNFDAMQVVLNQVMKLAVDSKPDLIVLLGDTLHNHGRINVKEHNYAISWINQLLTTGIECILLIGNHDRPNNHDFFGANHPFVGFQRPGLTIVASPVWREIKGVKILALPYVPPGRLGEALIKSHESQPPDVLLCHQEFNGADMEGYLSSVGDSQPDNPCLVISGHIHKYQNLGKVVYVGTPIQHTFGEDENKGVCLFHIWKDDNKIVPGLPLRTAPVNNEGSRAPIILPIIPSHASSSSNRDFNEEARLLGGFEGARGDWNNFHWLEIRIPSMVRNRRSIEVEWDCLDDVIVEEKIPTRLIIRGTPTQLKSLRHSIMGLPNVKVILAPRSHTEDEKEIYGFRREQLVTCSFATLMNEALKERPDTLQLWQEIRQSVGNEKK